MFHENLEKLHDNPEFKEWKKTHEDFFLSHAFFMENCEWQFGFYNSDSEKMVTFICGDKILHNKEEDILKAKVKITKLNPDDIKISITDAINKAKELLKEKYKSDMPTKHFVIIQNLDCVVFNITFLCQNFNTINIKIDAKEGKIVSDTSQKLASF